MVSSAMGEIPAVIDRWYSPLVKGCTIAMGRELA